MPYLLEVQRTCFACKFYEKRDKGHFRKLLKTDLQTEKIRLDCPEFEKRM